MQALKKKALELRMKRSSTNRETTKAMEVRQIGQKEGIEVLLTIC